MKYPDIKGLTTALQDQTDKERAASRVEYEVQFSLNLAHVFPEVDGLMKSLNGHLSAMGHDERLTLRGRPISLTVTTEREMTEEEIAKMKDLMTAQFCESFAGSNPVCELFRRKSGNVSQSAVQ